VTTIARRTGAVALALVCAALAWGVAGIAGPLLGTEALWPLDRLGAVLAVLAGVEALLGGLLPAHDQA
jgi:hypothetical protein